MIKTTQTWDGRWHGHFRLPPPIDRSEGDFKTWYNALVSGKRLRDITWFLD
jgi:hypothetical protein